MTLFNYFNKLTDKPLNSTNAKQHAFDLLQRNGLILDKNVCSWDDLKSKSTKKKRSPYLKLSGSVKFAIGNKICKIRNHPFFFFQFFSTYVFFFDK